MTATAVAIASRSRGSRSAPTFPAARTWVVVSALPLVIPSFVGGYAFVAALGPRGLAAGLARAAGRRTAAVDLRLRRRVARPVALHLSARAAADPRGAARARSALEEAARALGRTRALDARAVTAPPAPSGDRLRRSARRAVHAERLRRGLADALRFVHASRSTRVPSSVRSDASPRSLGLVLVALAGRSSSSEARTRGRAVYHATHRGARRRTPITPLGAWRWPAFVVAARLLVAVALVVPSASSLSGSCAARSPAVIRSVSPSALRCHSVRGVGPRRGRRRRVRVAGRVPRCALIRRRSLAFDRARVLLGYALPGHRRRARARLLRRRATRRRLPDARDARLRVRRALPPAGHGHVARIDRSRSIPASRRPRARSVPRPSGGAAACAAAARASGRAHRRSRSCSSRS